MQLVLPVMQSHDYRLDNFVVGQNAPLLNHIRQQLLSNSDAVHGQAITFIHGGLGSGKTHLLLALHQMLEANGSNCQYIDMLELKALPPQIIQDFALIDTIFVDNIDAVAQSRVWQIQMFDLINHFLENKGQGIVFAAKASVAACQFSLPDLASRLTWGTTFHLSELSDSEKVSALSTHFLARGISVQKEVLLFLMKRCERDMHKLMRVVEQLDNLSLQSKRKLTIPFVKQALAL